VANKKIPDPMERRHLLAKSLDAKAAIGIADAYLAEDRPVEALDFLAKVDAHDRIEAMVEQAIEAGDAFLLKSIHEALGLEQLQRDQWERLAAAADAAGKTLYASLAQRIANPAQQD
jgi:hypothetical protein